MDLQKPTMKKTFELRPTSNNLKAFHINRKRMLIGRANVCDVIIALPEVTSIHAVIEVLNGKVFIYDMNSTNGTFVNSTKVVHSEINIGDKLKFANCEYVLDSYTPSAIHKRPLKMLEGVLPPKLNTNPSVHLPPRPELKQNINTPVPRVSYPLASDENADYTEYIFEDIETLYPIFDYNISKAAIEIIILFKDNIFSIDYLSSDNGLYHLVGSKPAEDDVEFAYLAVDEKIPFIEITNNNVTVMPLNNYEIYSLKDSKEDKVRNSLIYIKYDEIIRFCRGDLQIFVRLTDHPPIVSRAPIFRRDKDFKKYFILINIFLFLFLSVVSLIEVNKDIEKEKAPERIAKILYNRKKLLVSKKVVIDRTKKAPIKVEQKSPNQKVVKKKKVTPKAKVVKRKVTPKKVTPKKTLVKKATANKGRKDNLKTNKVTPKKSRVSKAKKSSSRPSRTKSKSRSKSKGHVDTYKSTNFKSTLSNLLSKGGGSNVAKLNNNQFNSGSDRGGIDYGSNSATLKKAKVTDQVGSLSGDVKGKLDSISGTQGVFSKKSIVTAGTPSVNVTRGGLPSDVIMAILMQYKSQFQFCYQKELDIASRSFDGRVEFDFVIGASGDVVNVSARFSDRKISPKVKRCVRNVVRGIKFPQPEGGTQVSVNTNMNFIATSR